jgi:hypothetical protein
MPLKATHVIQASHVLVVIAVLTAASCGGLTEPTPTAPGAVPSRSNNGGGAPSPTPSPAPSPTPSPTPPPTAAGTGQVQVTIAPNPVPFSGQAFTDIASCATRPDTWFYDQTLKEVGGVAVTVTQRVDTFDGARNSPTNPGLRIAANGSTTIRTRWCSVSAAAHTAQTTFSGTDANGKSWTVTGPVVRMLAK